MKENNENTSDFIYADLPDGKVVALYKGKITLDVFQNISISSRGGGSVSNPPKRPNEILGGATTSLEYVLTFENPVPDEWMSSDFFLRVGDLKFTIESWINEKGITTTTAKVYNYD